MVDEFLNTQWLENAPEATRETLYGQYHFIQGLEDRLYK